MESLRKPFSWSDHLGESRQVLRIYECERTRLRSGLLGGGTQVSQTVSTPDDCWSDALDTHGASGACCWRPLLRRTARKRQKPKEKIGSSSTTGGQCSLLTCRCEAKAGSSPSSL